MINPHTIGVLEFGKVIEHIAGRCITPYGRPQVEQMAPMFDEAAIRARQTEVSQMKDIILFGLAFPLSRCEDARQIVGHCTVDGACLDPADFRIVLELVDVSVSLHGYDPDGRDRYPAIVEHLKRIRSLPELRKKINHAIDEDGLVRDRASSALKRIRMGLADTKRKVIARLEGMLSARSKQSGWQDDVVTQRNDRYVIPVLAGQYKSDEGILHDRSQSGATFYVEPKETVELNNRLNLLAQEERSEVIRILRELTAEVAQYADALRENCRIIGTLDALHAAASLAVDTKATCPSIGPRSTFDIRNARHPLLILQFKDVEKVIPLSLRLYDDRQAIVITGPNTGGKTIALKTIGLMCLMAQSGLLIPADEQSSVGLFEQIFADIGDEQSIELSLSTFSSHIRNISDAVDHVNDRALVLLDEIGAGTDPKEGAALAEAIILYMVEKGAKIVSSTHYSQLKTLAMEHSEIENASLEFDRETLAPTYRLQTGIPGSSYAIEIAGRLGVPESICREASRIIGTGERSLGDLIASLEKELAQVRQDRLELTERLTKARDKEEKYEKLTGEFERDVTESRRKALEETDQLLVESRREIERLVASIRRSQADQQKVKETHQFLKNTEQRAAKARRSSGRRRRKADQTDFRAGDSVRVISLDKSGQIVEMISDSKVRVQIGSVNTVVEIRNLEKLTSSAKPEARPTSVTPDVSDISPEIHLRGMTGEEAIVALEQHLDRAVLSGVHQVYVIHGKGTGALRRKLTDFLKGHADVESMRLGNWNEGGAGVTIVKLKA